MPELQDDCRRYQKYQWHPEADVRAGDYAYARTRVAARKPHGHRLERGYEVARHFVQMIATRRKLNETSQYQIEVGIGVASGIAVAGCMGSSHRLNYTVLGERVNLASRLCSKAGRMEIVIDQTTRTHLAALAQVEPLEPLVLKGFTDPVPAFKLHAIQPSPSTT